MSSLIGANLLLGSYQRRHNIVANRYIFAMTTNNFLHEYLMKIENTKSKSSFNYSINI